MDPLNDLKNKLGLGTPSMPNITTTSPGGGNLSVSTPPAQGSISIAKPTAPTSLSVSTPRAPSQVAPNIQANAPNPNAVSLQGQNLNLRPMNANTNNVNPSNPLTVKPYTTPPPSAAAPVSLKVTQPTQAGGDQLAQVAQAKAATPVKLATPPPAAIRPAPAAGGFANDLKNLGTKAFHVAANTVEAPIKSTIQGLETGPIPEAIKLELARRSGNVQAEQNAEQALHAPGQPLFSKQNGKEVANQNVVKSVINMTLGAGEEGPGLEGAIKKGNIQPDALTTLSGRKIQPPQYNPSVTANSAISKQLKVNDAFYAQEALNEARAKGDDFNADTFEQNIKDAKGGNLSQADREGIHLYLFGNPQGVKLTYGGNNIIPGQLANQLAAPPPTEPQNPLEFGNKEQIKQAQVSNEVGKAMEAKIAKQQARAINVAQPAEQNLFNTNELLRTDGQSDIFSAPETTVPPSTQGTDKYGNNYREDVVPVNKLIRNPEFQPRVTASGKGTEESVYKNGYRENPGQPILVNKVGDQYMVLGGHSRTLGMERRAAEGLPNPDTIKARIYDNIPADKARQISRGANQGTQYESTLDMAKSISDSRREGQEPAVQKQNLIKGYTHDDYANLWEGVNNRPALKEKIMQGALPSDEVLAAFRQGRIGELDPQRVAGLIEGLDKNGNFSRQNAVTLVKAMTGRLRAGMAREAQAGLFGNIESAVKATDLLKEFQKTNADLIRKRNAITLTAKEFGETDPIREQLNTLISTYNNRLQNIEDEIVNRLKPKEAGTPIAKSPTPSTGIKIAKPEAELTESGLEKADNRATNRIDFNLSPGDKVKALVKMTETNKPIIDNMLKDMDARLGTESSSNIKDPEKILEKSQRPSILARYPNTGVEHISDSFRFKTVIDHPDQIPDVISTIMSRPGVEVVKHDMNMMSNPKAWGWRASVLDLRMPNGQLVEFYMPFKTVEDVKNATGHDLFEKWRNQKPEYLEAHAAEYQADLAKSYNDYNDAYYKDLRNAGVTDKDVAASLDKARTFLESKTGTQSELNSSADGTVRLAQPPPEGRSATKVLSQTNTAPESETKAVGKPALKTSAMNEPPSTPIIPSEARNIQIQPGFGSPHQPELPIEKPPANFPQNIKVATGRETQNELLPETFKSNIPSVLGKEIGPGYSGPDLSNGAFTAEDQLRLNKQLDLDKVKEAQLPINDYAEKYNLTPLQAQQDYEAMAKDAKAVSNITKEDLDRFGPPISIEQKRELIATDPNQQTVHEIPFTFNGDSVQSGIAAASGISDERSALYNEAKYFASKLDQHDKSLLYRYDNGESITDLAQEAHNPARFERAAQKAIDALDYSLAADRVGGGATLRQQSYIPHYYAANGTAMDELHIPEDQRIKIAGVYRGYRDDSAKYKSYIEARQKAGLTPVFADPFEAIEHHGIGGTIKIRDQLLLNGIARNAPMDIGGIDQRRGFEGENFRPAANGELPFAVSDRVNNALTNFQKSWKPKSQVGQAIMKGTEIAGRGTKKGLFLGSFFHQSHITENVASASILGGQPRAFTEGLINEVRNTGGLTRGTYVNLLDQYRRNGVVQFARNDMGLVLHDHSALDRFINIYALTLAKAAKEGGIESGSQQAIDLGRIYNRLLGRDNAAVEARNPTIEKMTSYFTLAPHYLRTQLRLVADAFLPKKIGGAGYDRPLSLLTPGGAARSAVIGPRLFGALFAITASAIIMNKFPTWQQAAQEAGLYPNNTNPNVALGTRNSKGEQQVMNIPTDPLGLATGFVTDPQHFFQSRYSPLLSFGTKIVTNKNWNSQPLVNPNQPNQWPIRIERAGINSLVPIGIQNFTNLQRNPNNPSILQGLAQEFGGRLKTNPNDPQVKANSLYYNTASNVANTLGSGNFSQLDPSLKNVPWQQAQQFVNTFNSLHPTNTTDATGQKFPQQYNATSSEVKYNAYTMTDPTTGQRVLSPVFYADKKLENVTPGYPSSPLYKLNGTGTDVDGNTAPQALVALEYQHEQDPSAKTVIMNANGGQNGWLSQYENRVGTYSQNYQSNLTSFFQSLGWNSTAINNYWKDHPSMPDPINTVTFDKPTTNLINQYYSLSASDPTAASQFFSQNASVLGNAFDQMAQHANAIRSAAGQLQLAGYPAESPQVTAILNSMPSGSDKASKATRAQLINNNPDVSQYLADVALYESLDKGAQFRYINPANRTATQGQNVNAGGQAGQTFLKDTASLGNYDIGKNATTNQYRFMQGGGFPAGTVGVGGGGAGSTYKPIIALPPYPKRPPRRGAGGKHIRKLKAHPIRIRQAFNKPVSIKHGGPLKPSNVIKIAR